ncbi:PREDICTED: NADH dehydrogenase [ubiquinone] 1 subunit C1, mitochondrial [Thamnophis sirtalis]|uniref:NADH dehydrogenase [ubiquinone] 1 subunit C1, mitochondrial n=1 Tax=Thamnophis sirtalis TaxID=35019 RepID=A0A6I9YQD0_9SAUR|nr:PREDICTED: NADH dehydrogenase [ubiquinone] 1 subunit C1, mitochondrial [Thamnophis sirtalis]
MAATLRAAKWFLQVPSKVTPPLSRSVFQVGKEDTKNPNWIKVGLTLSSTVLLWVMLIKHHDYEMAEYERRKKEHDS